MRKSESTLAYDGSFPGFLCACAEALNAPDPAPRVVSFRMTESLFEERCAVRREDQRAAALWERLTRRTGPDAMKTLLEAFLSDIPEADSAAAQAMRRLRTEGGSALRDLSDPAMLAVEKAAHRAREEAHLITGLARFSELTDGSFYARVEPACDVLVLLADHFSARFGTMRFAIHDLRRGTAVIHEPNQGWSLVESFELATQISESSNPLSNEERSVRRLWNLYFETIAIESRLNPRLQSSHMPKRYWSVLVEMGGYEPH